jgi:protein phosphatase
MMKIEAFGVSDIGCVKHANEDHYTILPPDFDGMPYFFAVSDGVGGRKGGQLASVKVLQVIGNTINSAPVGKKYANLVLVESFAKANAELRKLSRKNENLQGMGTTAVVALVYDDSTLICSIGDSRAYAILGDNIRLITRDHSWTFELYDKGLINEKQLKNHPYRHHLVKALGIEDSANPDVFELENGRIDWLLLCSDGLTEHVPDSEILSVIKKENNSKNSCEKLLQMALARGGTDNITIVIAKMTRT